MSSELRLGGVPLTVKVNPRARRLRLRVDARRAGITLTVPPGVSQRRALAWAGEHQAWVERSIDGVPSPVRLIAGAQLPVYGRAHVVDWWPDRPRRVERHGDRLVAGGPEAGLEARLLRWLRGEAAAVLTAETAEFAGKAGVRVERVSVGDPASRWGSCSSAGAIRYSWRLILAPDFVRRATVAHEVAHRVHMDHSPRFHALVADLFGADPGPARAWLRREGGALHRIGGD